MVDSASEMLALFNQYTETAQQESSTTSPPPPQTTGSAIVKSGRRGGATTVTNTLSYSSDAMGGCIRTYHDLVQLGIVYDGFTRDDRQRCQEAIGRSLRSSERAIYTGTVTRRPVRDSIRALCYGARLNVDMVRENVLAHLEHLGMLGLNTTHITDKLLIKFIDAWYPYASMDTCDWQRMCTTSDDVLKMLKDNVPLRGIACRNCISALLRLSRSGVNGELGRVGCTPKVDPTVVENMDDGATMAVAGVDVPTSTKSRKRKMPAKTEPDAVPVTKRTKSSNGIATTTIKAKRTKTTPGDAANHPSLPDLSSTESFVAQPTAAVDVANHPSLPDLSSTEPTEPTAAAAVNAADPIVTKRTLPVARKTIRKYDEPPVAAMDIDSDDFDDETDDDDDEEKN